MKKIDKLKLAPCAIGTVTQAELDQAVRKFTIDFYVRALVYVAVISLLVYMFYFLDKKIKHKFLKWLGFFVLIICIVITIFLGLISTTVYGPYIKRDPESIDCFDPIIKYLDSPYGMTTPRS